MKGSNKDRDPMGGDRRRFMGRADSVPVGNPSKWKMTKMQAKSTIANTVDKILRSTKSKSFHHDGEQPHVLVGPVIGKVDSNSARILIEINKLSYVTISLNPLVKKTEAPVHLRRDGGWRSMPLPILRRDASLSKIKEQLLKSDGYIPSEDEESLEIEKELPAKRPTVFEFKNLRPDTRYKVEIKGCHSFVPSSFTTLPEVIPEKINVGVISCNNIYITEQAIPIHSDLWAHLAKSIENGKIDMLVHLGDQVYADVPPKNLETGGKHSNGFYKARDILQDLPKEQWQKKHAVICELYRDVYRETWQHPPTAKCLANCPNVMICDDHEIRDNWGDICDDWDSECVNFFIARCAWEVYLEYQRQLHEDIDFKNLASIKKDYHFHVIGGVGMIFLDIRGSRTFHRVKDDSKPYLGSQQWEDIHKALMPGGLFDETNVLLLCSPAPLVFLQPHITNVAAKKVSRLEDFKGHWSAELHIQEQVQMIEVLLNWKKTMPSRDVLILGGDVHCGGHSDILKNNKIIFQQLTSSAIANTPLPKSAYYIMRFAGRLGHLTKGYGFSHHHWTRSRNYGIVKIKNHRHQDKGKVEITSQLIKGKFMRGVRKGAKVSNNRVERRSSLFMCCLGQAPPQNP